MNKIYKLILLLFLPFSSMAQSQSITLEQCREMAIENSLNLKSSKEKILASEDMLKAYKANKLPNFSFSGGYLYSTASFSESITGGFLPVFSADALGQLTPKGTYAYMPDITFECEVGSVFNAGIQASQPIYMGGKISTAIKLAKIGVDVAEIEQTRTQADIVLSADEAFYTYLKVEELLLAANSYRAVVDEFYRQVESLLKNGMCTQNELLKVQVKVSEAELQQLKARNGLILARMNLCYIIGLPLTTREITVMDNFKQFQSLDTSLDVSSRAEYKLLEKSVQAKELEVKLAKSDLKPTVAAVASYSYTHGFKINNEYLLGSTPSFAGGVSVNIPIFHWGESQRKVSAARREVNIARNTQDDLVQKMTLELMQSINAYTEAQSEVLLTERTLAQSEENLRQSGKQYSAGMEQLSDYLEAQAIWQKAMSDLVEAKAKQRLAYANYCRIKGE